MNARSIDDLYDFVEKKKALPSPLFFHGLCREVKELERQITELQKKCRAADELAEFYGDFESWEATGWDAQDLVDESDVEDIKGEDLPKGGKRARQFQKDYPATSAQDAR